MIETRGAEILALKGQAQSQSRTHFGPNAHVYREHHIICAINTLALLHFILGSFS